MEYKGYELRVVPPCISENREEEYLMYCKMHIDNGYNPNGKITVDESTKTVTYHR